MFLFFFYLKFEFTAPLLAVPALSLATASGRRPLYIMQDWQRLVGENLVYTAIVDEDLIRQAAIIIINDRMCLPSSMYHFSSPLLLSLLHILPLFSFHYCIFFPSSPFITTYSSLLLPFHYAYFPPLLLSLLHISLVG